MEITNLHWECFRLDNQEKRPLIEVSETLNIPVDEIKKLLTELRKAEPKLFPTGREYLEFKKQNMTRDGHKLLHIDDINEKEIKQKF